MKKPVANKKIILSLCILGFFFFSFLVPASQLKDYGNNEEPIKNKETKKKIKEEIFNKLEIKAKGIAIYDVSSDTFVYEKNSNQQLPLASITKVMSSLSAIKIAEREKEEKTVKFAGKFWDLYDLLKFSLVSSSNSGIANISDSLSKTNPNSENGQGKALYEGFLGEMNSMAKYLDLNTVYFLNETGLDINEVIAGGYGSAKDVTKLFAYSVKEYPEVFEVTKYPEIKITSKDGEERISKNTNKKVKETTTLIASKTGTEDLSGANLVVMFDAGLSRPIVICILGSTEEDRFIDVDKLINATIEYLSL